MERGASTARLPPPHSPLRTNNHLRLCATVSDEDVTNGRLSIPALNQVHIAGASKSHSKNAFEIVFGPESTQDEICSNILPDALQNLFNGNDCSIISFGGKSRGKESVLYGCLPSTSGIFPTAINSVFRMMDTYKTERPDIRHQLRMSAVIHSQREGGLVDLLSAFNTDPRRKSVRISDDVQTGTHLENEAEIKVDSPEQALFYLDTVINHRLIEDEDTYRTNHMFVFLSLYSYRIGTNELEGGRRKLSIVDLGIGERNSQRGGMTMPVIGSVLLALFQGQKHLPSRENCLSQLLKCALSSSRLSVLLCSFGEKTDDNENIVQMASKLARAKKQYKRSKLMSDGSSVVSSSSGRRSELESGSEVSAAETVIFVGPSPTRTIHPLHKTTAIHPPRSPSISSKVTLGSGSSGRTCTGSVPPMLKGFTPFLSPSLRLYDDLCSPPGTSTCSDIPAFGGKSNEQRDDFGVTIATPRKKSKHNLDDEKRNAIMLWIEDNEGYQYLDEDEILIVEDGREIRDPCTILSHPLEDIIEQDEDSMKDSMRSKKDSDSHPLRILSKEGINRIDSDASIQEGGNSDEDALERAMAASISSIKSHDILAKLNGEQNSPKELISVTTGTASEMDMYRRASQLEEYALERIKELEEDKIKKKKSKMMLNCCQTSMQSSGSTVVDWSAIEKRRLLEKEKEEDERRKDELRKRREEVKLQTDELKREKERIDKELDDRPFLPTAIARQITQQLHNMALSSKSHKPLRVTSDSLPSTPTISHRKIISSSMSRTPSLNNFSQTPSLYPHPGSLPRNSTINGKVPSQKKTEGSHSRKTSKTRSEKKERRGSDTKEEVAIRSPYSKVTEARTTAGPASSGRGSDDNSCEKGKKRQSYSASSGYESASGDYHYYTYKDPRRDKLRLVDRRLGLGREADILREKQRRLKKELQEAKERIGQVDDARAICHDKIGTGISQATLLDTLMQENKILEKRLIACQNHTMLVTTFV